MKKLLLSFFYCSILFGQQFDDPANFRFSIDDIRKIIGADSLGFLSLEALITSVNSNKNSYCKACFTGDYPMPVQLDFDKFHLEKIKEKN